MTIHHREYRDHRDGGLEREAILSTLSHHVIGPIDRIEQVLVQLPFVKPFSISTATWTCKEALLLRIQSQGLTAWGECVLMADANGDYSLEDAPHLRQLDAFGLTMIEQPLSYHDIYEHSLLQQQLVTPLCLDESIHCLADARAAIDLGSCRVINVKQGRVGGLTEARSPSTPPASSPSPRPRHRRANRRGRA